MKLSYIIVSTLLLTGCGTVYRYSETLPETGRVRHTSAKTVRAKNACTRVENRIEKDTLTGEIQVKEMLRFDCRGSSEIVVACKKRQRQNGKLAKVKTACGKVKF